MSATVAAPRTPVLESPDRSRRRRDRWLRGLVPPAVAVVDVLIIFVAFAYGYLLRFHWQVAFSWCPPAAPEAYLKAVAIAAYGWLTLFKLHGLYDFSRSRSGVDTVRLIARSLTTGLVLVLALTYFYREFSFSRLVCLYAWGLALVGFCVFRLAVDRVREHLHRQGVAVRRVLLVGEREPARFFVEKIRRRPELGYRVVGTLGDVDDVDDLPVPRLGPTEHLEEIVRSAHIDRVFLVDPAFPHERLLEVIERCERAGVALGMVSRTLDLQIEPRDFEEFDGVPLVRVNEREARRVFDFTKRVFDLVLSVVLVVVFAPVALWIAWRIRREDGGPVLFVQRRVGRDGRVFPMLKFRTMVVDAEARLGELVDLDTLEEPVFKITDDPRVTRIGAWLRRSSLDELPQLINVLRGEMSLVGPRPEEERVVARYGVRERRRLKVLPGLTGLQQLECRGTQDLTERLRWDILYLRRRSLLLDLWILVRTVRAVIEGRGTL